MNAKIITLLILVAGLFVACSGDLDGVESGSAVLVGEELSDVDDPQQDLEVTLYYKSNVTPAGGATSYITMERNWSENEHLDWTATILSGSVVASGSFPTGPPPFVWATCPVTYTVPENPSQYIMLDLITVTAVDGSWTFLCTLSIQPDPDGWR